MNSSKVIMYEHQLSQTVDMQFQKALFDKINFLTLDAEERKVREAEREVREAERERLFHQLNQKLDLQAQEIAVLRSDVAIIKENSIIIRDRVISDFEGIQQDTKETLENQIEPLLELEEETQEISDYVTFFSKLTPAQKKEMVKVVPFLRSLQDEWEHGEKTACGNWVSAQLTKIFQFRFHSKYLPKLKELIESLTLFWAVERDGHQRAY